ncbi:glycerate kinase [Photobacterium aquimaris]|uniref:Glycerate kinase n=1 Tax=Photobacterium aquimaris TaxID=512643 RepID=A0A2T3IIR1_9GAMM|nr:glycerate kinase [Photobacterium aquimaris]OBU12573.1 glycerate kinase [Photobacterium aquimaris]OBU15275.1 glycerate kinase [Photobacterium aquimaris]PSU28229.1 glycerate kinase [Photobacterium aquimaris]PSW00161.1 glycerate kinase [Photobacterium aquimaris]
MKIIIAPDSYKESLTAMEVATAIETGFRQLMPTAEYIKLPMADGGEGTVQSLIDATNGTIIQHVVTGPLGEPVAGFFGIMGDGKTAVIEMAAASGLHLVSPQLRNPLLTTSYGTGELILAALDHGVEHIIVGIGGSATNDGGIGMAQALGVQLLDSNGQPLGFGGQALAQLAMIDISHIDPRLATIKLEVACDVDNPLCGQKGASQVFGPQKGATPAMVVELDQNLAHYAAIMKRDLAIDVKHMAGAGAAGGMGAALLGLFNAQLRSGIEIVIDAVNLETIVKDADLVITGEGRIDSQTIHGKTPIGVARAAKKFNKPVIGIAGCLSQDCGVVHQHGIDAVFSIVPAAMNLEQAFKDAAINVELTARNVAAMYCLGR